MRAKAQDVRQTYFADRKDSLLTGSTENRGNRKWII